MSLHMSLHAHRTWLNLEGNPFHMLRWGKAGKQVDKE
jgi:hypothetical protein